MYVCICNALTERQIARAVAGGAATAAQVYADLNCAPQCGKCLAAVQGLVRSGIDASDEAPPVAAE